MDYVADPTGAHELDRAQMNGLAAQAKCLGQQHTVLLGHSEHPLSFGGVHSERLLAQNGANATGTGQALDRLRVRDAPRSDRRDVRGLVGQQLVEVGIARLDLETIAEGIDLLAAQVAHGAQVGAGRCAAGSRVTKRDRAGADDDDTHE